MEIYLNKETGKIETNENIKFNKLIVKVLFSIISILLFLVTINIVLLITSLIGKI